MPSVNSVGSRGSSYEEGSLIKKEHYVAPESSSAYEQYVIPSSEKTFCCSIWTWLHLILDPTANWPKKVSYPSFSTQTFENLGNEWGPIMINEYVYMYVL